MTAHDKYLKKISDDIVEFNLSHVLCHMPEVDVPYPTYPSKPILDKNASDPEYYITYAEKLKEYNKKLEEYRTQHDTYTERSQKIQTHLYNIVIEDVFSSYYTRHKELCDELISKFSDLNLYDMYNKLQEFYSIIDKVDAYYTKKD